MIPPRSVLVGIDFSESSRAALAFGARLARHFSAALHVLHAEDPLLGAAAQAAGVQLACETRDELKRWVESLHIEGPIHFHSVTGPAVAALCNLANRDRLDVIVVGMHGMSGAARAMFGSTTEGVLRQAASSVFVVPDEWSAPPGAGDTLSGIGPVVAGLEFTEPSIAAAQAACRLAEALDTGVEILHVVPELAVLQRWRDHAQAAVQHGIDEARKELETIVPTLGAKAPIQLAIRSGSVPDSIASSVAPSEGRHPLLVLGRRNRSGRLGAPGQTAYRVLTMINVPVLLHVPTGH